MKQSFDIAVIGSGFGGISTALSLAENGLSVALFETLNYPGGCASTFTKSGFSFDAGATLSSGFAKNQLFARWISKYQLPVQLEWIDPVVHFRAPHLAINISSRPESLLDALCSLEGAPKTDLLRFFAHQARVAQTLWALIDEETLLPPINWNSLLKHIRRLPSYIPLFQDLGRSLHSVLERFQLGQFSPLTTYLDALCQITVQCNIAEAEALFALATMDYYSRGTAHIQGGMGVLARGLCHAFSSGGGNLHFSTRVKKLEPNPNHGWSLKTSRGTFSAQVVVANLLPGALRSLLPQEYSIPRSFEALQSQVQSGWGAAMLYMVAKTSKTSMAEHWQLVANRDQPFHSGNHVFSSISGSSESAQRGAEGFRTLTLSTHVPMKELFSYSPNQRSEFISQIQTTMRHTFNNHCPNWAAIIQKEFPASPRTFQRFTGRPEGFVGGIPKRVGLGQYLHLGPRKVGSNLFMVGDSTFPGQSALATAVGGTRVAKSVIDSWG